MRLFFAVWLPDEVRSHLASIVERQSEQHRSYRWVGPELLHVTLVFLGEVPETRLSELIDAGRRTAAMAPAGMLRLGEPGHFGSPRTPRALWVGLGGDVEALRCLHAVLVQELTESDFRSEERHFSPHITVARRRASARRDEATPWPPRGPMRPLAIPLRSFALVESCLTPDGAQYRAVEQFELEDAESTPALD